MSVKALRRLLPTVVAMNLITMIGAMLVACDAPSSREKASAVRIALLTAFTDPQGQEARQASELAVALAMEDGGVDVGGRRHPIELQLVDTGSAPWQAVEAARRLIGQGDVVALIGPSRSRDAIGVADVAEHLRVPMLSPASTHPDTTAGRHFVFRLAFTDPFQARVMAHFAHTDLGLGTAAVLYDATDVFSNDVSTEFRRFFEVAGGRIVGFEGTTPVEGDWMKRLETLRGKAFEALYLPSYSSLSLPQAIHARSLGIEAVFLGSDGWSKAYTAGEEVLEGAFLCEHWHTDLANREPASERFLDTFRAHHGQIPTSRSALTFDAWGVLLQAISRAGSLDPKAIRDAIAATEEYSGVTGPITFRGRGGDPEKRAVVVRLAAEASVVERLVDREELDAEATGDHSPR